MKKSWVLAVWLTSLTVICAPRSEAEQRPANVANTAQQQNPSPVAPPVDNHGANASNCNHQNQPPSGNTSLQWILVGVGIVTAAFVGWQALETRRAAQATQQSVGHMERQTGILEKSVAIAEANIEFFKRKERARFVAAPFAMYSLPDIPSGFYGDEYGKVVLQLTHVGPTDAINVIGRVGIVVQARDAEPPQMLEMENVQLPPVIKSGHQPMKLSLRIRLEDRAALDALKAGETSLHFFGTVTYEDVFGDTHTTRFRYVWRPQFYRITSLDDSGEVEGSTSRWETCGPPEDNQAT